MKVINVNGSQGSHYRSLGITDWMARKGTSLKPSCSVCGCNQRATDGAHVVKVGSGDRRWYMMPACHAHNMSSDELELKSDWAYRLIPLECL